MAKTKGLIKICPQCKEEFEARKTSVFCSRSCRNKFHGKSPSKETREKQRASMKKGGKNKGSNNAMHGKSGVDSPTYGSKRTEETKALLSQLKKGKYLLEKNPNWKGGKSFEPYPTVWTKELKTRIRKRDGFTCFMCGENGYDVHHIDYDKENCNPENLITLCRSCHAKTHHNRDSWLRFFEETIPEYMEIKAVAQ